MTSHGLPHAGMGYPPAMIGLIVLLLIIWIGFGIVGFAVKGLIWLAIIGIALFIITGIFGLMRGRSRP